MEPTEQHILDQLEQIERSRTFSRSQRMREFLRFLVLRRLAEPDTRITAYVIGREVFRRSKTFDPNEDPLVRVEAVRLRKLLHNYYAEHTDERVLISIPKGQYAPQFALPAKPNPLQARDYNAIGLLVVPIDAPATYRDLGLGVSSEVLTQLSRVGELRIVNGSGLPRGDDGQLYRQAQLEFGCDYVLEGQVLTFGKALRLTVQLTNTAGRELLWSDQYALPDDPAILFEAINDISAQVVRKVGTPSGAVFADQLFKRLNKPPATWDAVDCMVRWHAFRLLARSKPLYQKLLTSVAAVQKKDRTWHMGHCIASYLQLDAWLYRMDTTVSRERALGNAKRYADLALSDDQTNPMSHYMQALIAYFGDDLTRFSKHVHNALERGPGNTDIMHHAGTLLTWGGKVNEGEALILRADLEYQNAIGYRQFFIVRAYRERDFQEMRALLETSRYSDSWYLANLLQALCAVNLDDRTAALGFLRRAVATEPSLSFDMELEIDKWIKEPTLAARMREDLVLAGYVPQARSVSQ